MESFTIGWPRLRILTGLGRNQLLRISDRVESIATVCTLLIVILAVPVAAAFGTTVHDRRSLIDAEYLASIHQTQATVVGDATPESGPQYTVFYSTPVQWYSGGHSRTATIDWRDRVRVGDQIALWVNESGEFASTPAPPDQAARDGITVAIVLWMIIIGAASGVLWLLRWRLDAARLASWDRELDALADDGSRQ